jgi:transposase
MARHGLSDEQWAVIEDYFPKPKKTGRPPMAARRVFDAICWMVNSGAPWRDLPMVLGPWETVYGRYNGWSSDGTLKMAFTRLKERFSEDGRFDHSLWSVDGTIVRAHRCAAGGGKKGIPTSLTTTRSAAPVADFPRKST